jgi:3-oxoacyl-[acyl-carrier protein] reductase
VKAVVTGAARGIGRAISHRLARDGYSVVMVDVSSGLADAALDVERSGSEPVPIQVDLTSPSGIDTVIEACDGRLDLLVNNAGITRDSRLVNMTDEAFDSVIEVNLGVAYRLSVAAVPVMAPAGAIVNIASRAYLGNFGQFNYSMSKGGVVGLTRAMALRLAPDVRVNAIAPGLIGTEMAMGIPEDIREKMVAAIPLARMGQPEEVAALVAFLGSGQASYLTGQVVVIGGGRSFT